MKSLSITVPKTDLREILGRQWVVLFLAFEIVFFAVTAPGFMSLRGIQIIFFFGTSVFLLGVAEAFVIITGGIDLSVGFVMGFSTVVSTKLVAAFTASGLSGGTAIFAGIVLMLLIGLVPGIVNGFLIAYMEVPPFIATFSMLGITHGVSELILEGEPAKNLPLLANVMGNGYLAYYVPGAGFSFFSRPEVARGVRVVELVPNIVVLTFIVVAIAAFVLKRTRFGLHTYAVGGSTDAALRSGINVKRHLVAVYAISSFFAALGGVVYMLQYVTGKADAGAAFLLDSIAAVVIGGASLSGGSGSIWRTVLGALVIATLEAGLRMLGVPTFDKYILVGVILIGAVMIDQIVPERVHREE